MLPLPAGRFPSFEEGQRKVGRDGHVEVAKAYYSVPPEYLGRSLWVRWDSHTVRIFNFQFQQVEFHSRREPGQFSTHDRNIPPQKRSGIERGTAYNLNQASLIGPQTGQWAEQMVQQRGIEGVRVFLQHAEIVTITGKSYRLKGRSKDETGKDQNPGKSKSDGNVAGQEQPE